MNVPLSSSHRGKHSSLAGRCAVAKNTPPGQHSRIAEEFMLDPYTKIRIHRVSFSGSGACVAGRSDKAASRSCRSNVQTRTDDSLIRSWPGLSRGPSAHGLDPWASTSRGTRPAGSVDARLKAGHERLASGPGCTI